MISYTVRIIMTYTVPVTKSESLTVRVSPALRAALEAEAAAGGETLTKVVQRHLTAALAEDHGRRRRINTGSGHGSRASQRALAS